MTKEKKQEEQKELGLTPKSNFIRNIVAEDLKNNKNDGRVVTRFPPEPNGYLHIGHAKSICLNFSIAAENEGGVCHLRFDDTNPAKEDEEYMEAIKDDIQWLGFDWGKNLFHASDYFDKLYQYAIQLIKMGKAYVCNLTSEEIRQYRGTLTEPGKNSPYRDRPVKENLELFEQMKNGGLEEGSHVLRAKIDMASPNINMRDPIIYRIKKIAHHRTGDKWCIYPMYDYTHCLSDAMEAITHSICTLEFEDHRPLYDWFLDELQTPYHPQQIEFARLNLDYTVMSKRKLLELVENKHVTGWDDPRMPTIIGMRRRGITPAAIRDFCERIGVTKKDSCIALSTLETIVREDLDRTTKRVMAVLRPLKVVLTNYPEDKTETISAKYHPKDESFGRRELPFSNTIYIEHDDFMEDAPKKFFRLTPGKEVRLRYSYVIKCNEVVKDPTTGEILELRCSYDPETLGGKTPDGRKVKGIIHWVCAKNHQESEVRLYDRPFSVPNPLDGERPFEEYLNPDSLKTVKDAKLEISLKDARAEERFQFERQGYFCADRLDSKEGRPVFNRTVTLRDSWAKIKTP